VSFTREQPEFERPVRDIGDLLVLFESGEKPREAWRVGTEHEKFCLDRETLRPVPYDGPRGIAALFRKLVREHGFSPLFQGELILGLERDGTSITIEPGGAFELAGAPLVAMSEMCREFRDHLALVKYAGAEFGMIWVGLGMQPIARLDEIPRMPHERYAIMRSYLERRGSGGLYMMHATSGVQASFDYDSEQDMARKVRLAAAAGPLVTALYANSCITEGRPNGFESRRAEVWRDTDPDRCGLLPFVFEKEWLERGAYRRYADWALDVPMFFVRRESHHHPMSGRTFREYLASPPRDLEPTLADWNLHLTTLFPEVRLKRLIEVRGADAVAPGMVCALPALWKGLFYDPSALDAGLARLLHWTHRDVDRLHADVARTGLAARTPDGPALAVARELVEIAAAGLRRIGQRDQGGDDESAFLDPLFQVLDRGASPARQVLELWETRWQGRVERLVEYASY
jgi:glutamate--cysteine ligase